MLSMRVAQIPPMVATTVQGHNMPIQFNCHQAVSYWIYHEVHGTPPMGWAFVDSNLYNTTALMTEMAKFGKAVTQANVNGLPNGTVLIFTDTAGTANHSCIIDANGQIGGYNQQSWFTSPGTPNQFSQHAKAHIRWRPGHEKNNVLLSSGAKGRLVYVDEATALQFARFKF